MTDYDDTTVPDPALTPADTDVEPEVPAPAEGEEELPARTAGEQHHVNPDVDRGEDADAPTNPGRPSE